MKNARPAVIIAAIAVILLNGATASACPFCSVESQTLSEETASADAVVLARQIAEAKPVGESDDPNSGTAKFEVIEVLRGKEVVGDTKQIDVVHFGEFDRERVYLVMGLGAETPDWTTPLPLSKAADEYVRKLATLPPSGVERVAFFQEYLEHEDPLLAQDAYDEFARASYEDVLGLGPKMHHDRLVKWISDLEISPSRRRLYFTMLGACGSKDDLPLLESLIVSDFDAVEPQLKQSLNCGLAMGGPLSLPVWLDIVAQQERQKKLGLDALVACYLTLRGGDGLDLIDNRFLKDPKTDYTQVYSTIMALRFHGDQETGVLPKERLLESMRLLLDNPDFADQVVLDLSRWEDWSVMDRLVEMFKTSKDNAYMRQPVITYLTVASDQASEVGPRAKSALAELESLDPDTVKQARNLMAFGALSRARADGAANAADDADTASEAASPPPSALSAQPNAESAFAASADDDTTDPADIADPAAYEEHEDETDLTVGATDENGHVATKVAEDPKSNAATVAASTRPDGVDTPSPEPILLIGVPLFAAAALMGIYWLILRIGAV